MFGKQDLGSASVDPPTWQVGQFQCQGVIQQPMQQMPMQQIPQIQQADLVNVAPVGHFLTVSFCLMDQLA